MVEVAQTPPWVMATLVFGVILMAATSVVMVAAALYLRRAAVREEEQRRHWWAVWRPALHDIIEGHAEPESLTEHIPPRLRRLFLDFLLEYMRLLKGSAEDRLRLLGAEFSGSLRKEMRSSDETRRALAIEVIGTFGIPEHLDLVNEALKDDSNLVAMIAAHTLAAHGSPLEIAAVLDVLDRFTYWDRRHLASFLHRVGPDISAALVVIMTDPHRPLAARIAATETLEHMCDPRGGDMAADMLGREEPVELHTACLRLVSAVGRPEHEPMVRNLFSAKNEILRMNAVTAWSRIAGVGNTGPLVKALDDPSNWVAIRAAHALHEMRAFDVLDRVAHSTHPRAALARSMAETA